MDNYLVTVILLSLFINTVLTEADLQQQNADQDQLIPLNDYENVDNSAKSQDKRTIFGSPVPNYAWTRHVGYHPTGLKYVLSYAPLTVKYAPLFRPAAIKHYGRPKFHVHVKRPVIQVKPPRPVYGPWKPTTAVIRPVLPPNVPPPPPHVDEVAVAKPVHVDHVHAHVDHVHSHVDHIHTIPHVDHFHKVPVHVDHVHPVAQPVHIHPVPVHPVAPIRQPLLPAIAPAIAPAQFIPSHLFEVTKPNLGVLPLGAVFPSPILRNLPSPHVHFPLKPTLVHQPVVPTGVSLPHPQPTVITYPQPTVVAQQPALPVAPPSVVPQPIGQQPVYAPGTVVEYHGTTGFINIAKGQVPVLPQTPVNAVQPHHHYYLQYPNIPQNIPVHAHEQHDVQTPIIPDNHPHLFQHSVGQQQFQQQLPQDTPSHFQAVDEGNPHNIFQQQLPINHQSQFHSDQNNQNFIQQQVPQDTPAHFQPADQVSSQQFFQHPVHGHQGQFQPIDQSDGGYIYQQPETTNAQQAIHPGQTDLQLPLHLPQHPGFVQNSRQFEPENFHDSSQFSDNVFRPSIQLEPPYKK